MPEGVRGRHRQGHVPASSTGRRASEDARAAARLGHDPARGDRGGGAAREDFGVDAPTSGAPPASTSCAATATTVDALEPAASRGRSRARATSTQCLEGTAGPVDRGDRLHAALRRSDPAVRAAPLRRARHRRLRPQRHPRALRRLLRGRPPLRGASRRSRRWPTRARSGRRWSRRRSRSTGSTRRSRTRSTLSDGRIRGRARWRRCRRSRSPTSATSRTSTIIEVLVAAGRRGPRGGPADHARDRQGDHGGARRRSRAWSRRSRSRSATRCPRAT